MSEVPGYVPPSGDPAPAPVDDRDARIAELEAALEASKASTAPSEDATAPVDVADAPVPSEAADDPDADEPHIVTHTGERMLVSEYRKTKEFLEGFVKGE